MHILHYGNQFSHGVNDSAVGEQRCNGRVSWMKVCISVNMQLCKQTICVLFKHLDLSYIFNLSPGPMQFIFSLHKRHIILTTSQRRHAVTWWGEIAFAGHLSHYAHAEFKSHGCFCSTQYDLWELTQREEITGRLGLCYVVRSEGFKGLCVKYI